MGSSRAGQEATTCPAQSPEEKALVVSRLTSLLFAVTLAGAAFLPGLCHPPPAQAEAERLVLAFYYSWFDKNTWNGGKVPDLPQTTYNSDNREAMARHIDQAKSAGIDAFVFNWWGKGNRTEKNLKTMLGVAAEKGFRLAVDFDINSPFMAGTTSYADNLRHLLTVHAAHPAYLRYQGRPVVFFYNVSRLSVATWQSLRDQTDPGHNALWIAEGTDLKYLSVFDGHHLYSITWPNRIPPDQTLPDWGSRLRKYNQQHGTNKLWVATVMPGYDDRKARPGAGFARSRDGGDYYRQCWQAAIASKPHWIIVNSFNEWPEGSYIEPSKAFGSLYLDLTREWAGHFKGADFAVNAVLPPPPTATPPPPPPPPTVPPPTPTPTAPAYFARKDQAFLSEHLGSECGYLPCEAGAECSWVIHCVTGSAIGQPVPLAY
jgi:hypothetical protein